MVASIRGIGSILSYGQAEPGRFYYQRWQDDLAALLQCVRTPQLVDGNPEDVALLFPPAGAALSLEDIKWNEPLIAVGDVHVRVDPLSIVGSSSGYSAHAGMFLIHEESALVTIASSYRQWTTVNLSTGRIASFPTVNWVAFSRWSLVTDDEHLGEEVMLASFGDASDDATVLTKSG